MRLEDHPLWPTVIQMKEAWDQLKLPDVFESHTMLGLLYHLDAGVILDCIFSVSAKSNSGVLFSAKSQLWPYFCFNCWVLGMPRPEGFGRRYMNAPQAEEIRRIAQEGNGVPPDLYDPAIAYASVGEHLRQRDDALECLREVKGFLSQFLDGEELLELREKIDEVLASGPVS